MNTIANQMPGLPQKSTTHVHQASCATSLAVGLMASRASRAGQRPHVVQAQHQHRALQMPKTVLQAVAKPAVFSRLPASISRPPADAKRATLKNAPCQPAYSACSRLFRLRHVEAVRRDVVRRREQRHGRARQATETSEERAAVERRERDGRQRDRAEPLEQHDKPFWLGASSRNGLHSRLTAPGQAQHAHPVRDRCSFGHLAARRTSLRDQVHHEERQALREVQRRHPRHRRARRVDVGGGRARRPRGQHGGITGHGGSLSWRRGSSVGHGECAQSARVQAARGERFTGDFAVACARPSSQARTASSAPSQ